MTTEKKPPQNEALPGGLNPDSDLPPDADIEERFNDFWKRNGVGIFGGIAVGAVAVLGIQFFQHYNLKKEEGIQTAFAEAQTVEQKTAFAAEHPDHQLGALADLQVADIAYEDEAYTKAAETYAKAAQVFEDPTLRTRALLGQGMSLLLSGSVEAGQGILETVALDTSALAQTRGEAAYNLAVSFWEAGNLERVGEVTDLILGLEAPFWVFRANNLRNRLELSSPDDAS